MDQESSLAGELFALAERRVLILPGAMGSFLLAHRLAEAEVRGRRFASHPQRLARLPDVLVLSRPELVVEAHAAYLEAGADFVETNTFNAQAVSLAPFALAELAYELNYEAASLARRAVASFTAQRGGVRRFVAGNLGPTTVLALGSDDGVLLARLRDAYATQVRGLFDGGADVLLLETVCDTRVALAACAAMQAVFEERGRRLPLLVSATLDGRGRLPSGAAFEDFVRELSRVRPLSLGINCSEGALPIRPWLAELAAAAPCLVSVYPNAGLPEKSGVYPQSAEETAELVAGFAALGLANLVGGCCGTTPGFVQRLAEQVSRVLPRRVAVAAGGL